MLHKRIGCWIEVLSAICDDHPEVRYIVPQLCVAHGEIMSFVKLSIFGTSFEVCTHTCTYPSSKAAAAVEQNSCLSSCSFQVTTRYVDLQPVGMGELFFLLLGLCRFTDTEFRISPPLSRCFRPCLVCFPSPRLPAPPF